MTTIVANLECMAADQRTTDDGGPPFCHTTKLHRIGRSIFGIAGDAFMATALIEWLSTPKRDRVKLYKMFGDDVAWRYEAILLELSPDGLAIWNGWGVRLPILDKVYGIGTGSAVAVDAVESTGASPEDAVRRAMKRDQFSGVFAEPQVLYLDEPQPKRKRG